MDNSGFEMNEETPPSSSAKTKRERMRQVRPVSCIWFLFDFIFDEIIIKLLFTVRYTDLWSSNTYLQAAKCIAKWKILENVRHTFISHPASPRALSQYVLGDDHAVFILFFLYTALGNFGSLSLLFIVRVNNIRIAICISLFPQCIVLISYSLN